MSASPSDSDEEYLFSTPQRTHFSAESEHAIQTQKQQSRRCADQVLIGMGGTWPIRHAKFWAIIVLFSVGGSDGNLTPHDCTGLGSTRVHLLPPARPK